MANTRFQNALKMLPQATPPVWFMRQAGRYHKHYQALRAKHSFMELCKNPTLAAQVALGPIEDFDFDLSIFFSDLLFPLEALGMGLEYTDSGPKLGFQLNSQTLRKLKSPDAALPQLQFQKAALAETRKLLPQTKSLIGFVGSPWTLFTYAVQGKHSGSLQEVKSQLGLFKPFCEVMVPLLKANIQLQLEGGAEIVMLFDTAAGEISPWLFHDLVVPELQKLAQAYPQQLGYYSKLTHPDHLKHPLFEKGQFAGLGIDHRWSMANYLQGPRPSGFVQGNFDEALLFGSFAEFQTRLQRYLEPLALLNAEQRRGWVCGLGHGVLPHTPEEHVRYFVNTIREVFK